MLRYKLFYLYSCQKKIITIQFDPLARGRPDGYYCLNDSSSLTFMRTNLHTLLKRSSPLLRGLFLGTMAFCTYFCMYAFRKPFSAAIYSGISLWGIDYKIILVVAQVLGYATAKGMGIKVVAEVKPHHRMLYIIGMILYAEICLLMFALVPAPDNWMFMYLNGLGLGMIFGLVFSYLEGRRITDLLGAGLAVSFIVSSGIIKSVSRWALDLGINEFWMPFVIGVFFFPLLVLAVWGMNSVPKPDAQDKLERVERVPMFAKQRRKFMKKYGLGMVLLVSIYVLMTIFRDIRDNFGVEIWKELGISDIRIFSETEIIIGILISIMTGVAFLIKNHKNALWFNHLLICGGCILMLISTLLYNGSSITGYWWMVCNGLGLYMVYVPFNGILFDRLLAALNERGNVGFLFYTADFCGYLGSVLVLLIKNFGKNPISWLDLLNAFAQLLPTLCIVLVISSYFYFNQIFQFKNKSGIRFLGV